MPRNDLKSALKDFFSRYKSPEELVQVKMKAAAMGHFRAAKNQKTMHRWVFWRRTSFALTMVICVTIMGLFGNSLTPNAVKAGKILAEYGPVEIIRGEKSFLVRDEADIFVGDLVRVGLKGEAKLNLKNQGVSKINEKTHLIVTDKDALFIEKGRLDSEAFRGVEFATDHGLILTTPGAKVLFEVSETGQTRIVPEKNLVQVFDLLDGQAILGKGEELILHSDTQLSLRPMPTGLALSEEQLDALRSKLAITRSKVVSAIEKQIAGSRLEAEADFLSAEQTFKSLTQVLLTSRQLEIASRKNLNEVAVEEVYEQLSERLNHSGILAETASLTQVFAFFKNQEKPLAVKLANSGDTNLDRYLLLKRIADQASGTDQIVFEELAAKYIVNFLQSIQNELLFADRQQRLQEKVASLPTNADTYYFLRRVGQKMSPELAATLEGALADHF